MLRGCNAGVRCSSQHVIKRPPAPNQTSCCNLPFKLSGKVLGQGLGEALSTDAVVSVGINNPVDSSTDLQDGNAQGCPTQFIHQDVAVKVAFGSKSSTWHLFVLRRVFSRSVKNPNPYLILCRVTSKNSSKTTPFQNSFNDNMIAMGLLLCTVVYNSRQIQSIADLRLDY